MGPTEHPCGTPSKYPFEGFPKRGGRRRRVDIMRRWKSCDKRMMRNMLKIDGKKMVTEMEEKRMRNIRD